MVPKVTGFPDASLPDGGAAEHRSTSLLDVKGIAIQCTGDPAYFRCGVAGCMEQATLKDKGEGWDGRWESGHTRIVHATRLFNGVHPSNNSRALRVSRASGGRNQLAERLSG